MERLVKEDTFKVQNFISAKVLPEVVEFDALLGSLGPHLTADLLEVFAKLYKSLVKGVDLELSPVKRFSGNEKISNLNNLNIGKN